MLGTRNFPNIYECYCQGYFKKNREFGKIVEFHLNSLILQ